MRTLVFLLLLAFLPSKASLQIIFEDGFEQSCDFPLASLPQSLSETGLYRNIQTKTTNTDLITYQPQFEAWIDELVLTRWICLPAGEAINNTDSDIWDFPVGTKAFQEVANPSQRLETRVIYRFGPGADDFRYGSYLWNQTESDALLVASQGQMNVLGTSHDIPAVSDCQSCHGGSPDPGGLPSRVLGFSSVQLNYAGAGVDLSALHASGAFTQVPIVYTVPGTALDRSALGYLHANCSGCHNKLGEGVQFPSIDMRLDTDDQTVSGTASWQTLVGQGMQSFIGMTCDRQIDPQNVPNSCVHLRMNSRVPGVQMPPIDTELIDSTGVSIIQAWINSIPP